MKENFFDIKIVNLQKQNAEYVKQYEDMFDRNIMSIADDVISQNEKLIMLTGPSSSGKTTTAFKIQREFEKRNIPCVTVSLDCFFKNKSEIGYDEQGKPDFEKPQALELDLVSQKLNQLQKDGKAMIPVFDFVKGIRIDDARQVDLKGGVAIIEGIHALNPLILDHLSTDKVYKIYISVHSGFEDNGAELLNKRSVRFIRRLVRDYNFRGSCAENTFMLWENVIKDEVQFVLPYKVNADKRIDSTMPFGVGVLKNQAAEILSHVQKDSKHYSTAAELMRKLSSFEEYSSELLPKTSLIREFCGGSDFNY